MCKNVSFETERLLFCPIRKKDAKILFPLSDNVVTKYMTWEATSQKDMAAYFSQEVENMNNGKTLLFLVSTKFDEMPIGCVGLHRIDGNCRDALLGYWLGKHFWNKGYGTESVEAIVKYGFEQIRLHRIYCSIFVKNVASIEIMKKCGFRKEGHSIKSFLKHGHHYDLYHYAILAEDYSK